MSPIRRGDGTGLDAKGFSEIRKGDGTVLYSAIPDSVVYQVRAGEFASPWPFNIGSVDMSITGLSASTFSNGEESVAGDGTGDYGTAPLTNGYLDQEQNGLAFTIQFNNPTENARLLGYRNVGNGANRFWVGTGVSQNNPGDLSIIFSDANDNTISVETDSTFDDGAPHAVIINKNGDTASGIEIYVDDMASPVSTHVYFDESFDHTNSSFPTDIDIPFWAYNGAGSISDHFEADAGVYEFNNSPYSQTEREGFVNRRPEV